MKSIFITGIVEVLKDFPRFWTLKVVESIDDAKTALIEYRESKAFDKEHDHYFAIQEVEINTKAPKKHIFWFDHNMKDLGQMPKNIAEPWAKSLLPMGFINF